MPALAFNATMRNEIGKGPARRLRQKGLVPAILYGKKSKPVQLAVDRNQFVMEMKRREAGERHVILTVEGEAQPWQVVLQAVQQDPVTYLPIHIDFMMPADEA